MSKVTTKAGATVTTTKAGKARTVALTAPVSAFSVVPKATPAPAAQPAPTVAAVCVRGTAPVQMVKLGTKNYKVKAPHTAQRWAEILAALSQNPAGVPVATLTAPCKSGAAAHNYTGPGVPSHFIGYALRHGYLTAV